MLHIIPATYKGHQAEELEGTRVLMKSGKKIMALRDDLIRQNAMMVEYATMENEKVYKNLIDLKEQSSYFSLIVIHSEDRQKGEINNDILYRSRSWGRRLNHGERRRTSQKADVIIYAGSLVNPALLDYAKESCKIYNSAKMTLEEVTSVMKKK